MILPTKYSIAKLMNERYPPLRFVGFSYETKRLLIDLFTAMIEGEKSNEEKTHNRAGDRSGRCTVRGRHLCLPDRQDRNHQKHLHRDF